MHPSDVSPPPRAGRRYLAIAQHLLNEVQQGAFGDEGRLPADRDLAARFHTSRPTVREAVFVLELVGVLEVRQGDGTYVARARRLQPLNAPQFLMEQPRHLIEARMTLEPPATSLVAADRRNLDSDTLLADLDRAESMIGVNEHLPTFVHLAMKFHADILTACPNPILSKFAMELVSLDRQPLWVLINQLILQDSAAQEELVREHRDVLECVLSGDNALANEHMHGHLSFNRDQLFGARVQKAEQEAS